MELVYFWKAHCPTCAQVTPVVTEVAAARGLRLTSLDARSPEAGDAILRLGISELPSLAILHKKHKLAVLDDPRALTAKKLNAFLDRLHVDA